MLDFNIKLSCKEYAKQSKEAIKEYIENKPIQPTVAIVQIGDNEQSNSYVKYKVKDCEYVGIRPLLYKVNENISQLELEGLITILNDLDSINGIIIQLPLPKHLHIEELIKLIDPEKDVDGFRSDSEHSPCTALGIIEWLKTNHINLDGTNIVIVGRGITAGAPLAELFVKENANVTICHSHTREEDLSFYCANTDIIVSAAGQSGLIHRGMVMPETLCIDVGRGDFTKDIEDMDAIYLTPTTGGVGLLTRTFLLSNVLDAYYMQNTH